jgi:formylglycine-generating enzyme required for sulfatase activity
MVWVEGGTFQMGSDGGDGDERPVHTVTVRGFYLGACEVTQGEWREVMGSSPSHFAGDAAGAERVIRGGSWSSNARGVRPAYRSACRPPRRDFDTGFRVCISAKNFL